MYYTLCSGYLETSATLARVISIISASRSAWAVMILRGALWLDRLLDLDFVLFILNSVILVDDCTLLPGLVRIEHESSSAILSRARTRAT